MKNLIKLLVVLLGAALIGAIALWLFSYQNKFQRLSVEESGQQNNNVEINSQDSGEVDSPAYDVIAENLSIPWDAAFLSNGTMLVTERGGDLLVFEDGTESRISIPGVTHTGEGGLLGIALHPNFSENNFLYLYHTSDSGQGLVNRVVRYQFTNGSLSNLQEIIGNIPGARYHDGGRISFGPPETNQSGETQQFLYITVGDAGDPQSAQDTSSLAGSILRINDDGSIPADNPFGNLADSQAGEIWSYGHRNPQGLAWDDEGRLWSTEHGRSGALSGLDEINLIEKGANYGWPDSQGDEVLSGTIAPALHSGANDTWAPASALHWNGSLFFGGLRGEALYEAVLEGENVVELREHFKGEFGRIRTVTLGPNGMFYLTTSNRDGRGAPAPEDDKIIKIDPTIFR